MNALQRPGPAVQQERTAQGPGQAQSAKAVAVTPFRTAAKLRTLTGQRQSFTLGTTAIPFEFSLPSSGYLYAVYLDVTVTAASNAATVAFAADAPWNVFQQLRLRDAGGTYQYNVDGWGAFKIARDGGYRLPDLASWNGFSTTPGVGGGAGGSFSFMLPLHIGFGRDANGIQPNQDAKSQYVIEGNLNTIANIYTTPPTNAPTISITPYIEVYNSPAQVDQLGNGQQWAPPSLGTTQYWTKYTQPIVVGANNFQLTRTGYYLRNIFCVSRNASGARAAQLSNFQWQFNNLIDKQENPRLRDFINYRASTLQPLTGCHDFDYTNDNNSLNLADYGDQWRQTLTSSNVTFFFDSSAAGTLDVFINDVVCVNFVPGMGDA